MKKLKFMLLSFALLAIIGTALAFKAKFQITYCTAQINDAQHQEFGVCTIDQSNQKLCPNQLVGKTTIAAEQLGFFCYTTPAQLDGVGGVECQVPNVATVPCKAVASTIYRD